MTSSRSSSRRRPAQRRPAQRRPVPDRGIRLQKVLAAAGVASRRAAEEMIAGGHVSVDGRIVTEMGTRVDAERARIEVDGRRVAVDPAREYWILNKPPGVVTTARDPEGRPTVVELVPTRARVFPVGRLDAETTGLVLLTNDGALAHRLMHPRYGVARTYVAEVRGDVPRATVERLARGVRLEDGTARAISTRVLRRARARSQVEVTMGEGRKREVRRMLEAVGHPVLRLVRVSYGPLRLGSLRAGHARRLAAEEVGALLAAVRL